ncbi:MAG: GAF domain-containing protein [bacterium]|nr:GAF domain-containing protein [bacterium]
MPPIRNYEALYKLARAMHHLDKTLMMEQIVTAAALMMGTARGCLALLRDETSIDAACAVPLGTTMTHDEWDALLAKGALGFVIYSERTVIIRNVATDPRWVPVLNWPRTGSAIGLLLQKESKRLGVLLLAHAQVDYFDTGRVALLEEIASVASAALSNALRFEALRLQMARFEAVHPDTAQKNGHHALAHPEAITRELPRVELSNPPLQQVPDDKAPSEKALSHDDSASGARDATNTVQSPF